MMASDQKQALLLVLQAAVSNDPQNIKEGEAQLKVWEKNNGFHLALLDVFFDTSVDVNTRWLAIVYFKNGIEKYWRSLASCHVPDSEKVEIRKALISQFDQPVLQLATQLAVVVAKIARMDIKVWPEVVNETVQAIYSENELIQHRALLTLNEIMKALASKRLSVDRLLFKQMSGHIFGFLVELWEKHFNTFVAAINNRQEKELLQSLEMLVLLTKVLRKAMVQGVKMYDESSMQLNFLKLILRVLRDLINIRLQLMQIGSALERCEKLMVTMMKVLADVQLHHGYSFLPVLPTTLEFVIEQVFIGNNNSSFEKFLICNCNLLRSIIKCASYRKTKAQSEGRNQKSAEAFEIKSRYLTPETVDKLCKHLVANYFPLTKNDLEEWECDPEKYSGADEVGESFKYVLRSSGECLFLSLFYEYRTQFFAVIVELVEKLNGNSLDNFELILQKEAVYHAIGLASYELFDEFNFDTWFINQLVPDLHKSGVEYTILHNRVLWLIGRWINVKFSAPNRILLYQIICNILKESKDIVVKLTTSETLRLAVDEIDFKVEDFEPFLEASFTCLCKFLMDVSECDTKMKVLNVISLMIERVGIKVRCYMSVLTEYLPALWSLSEDHNLLRCSVISAVTHVVKNLGEDSERLQQFIIPVINLSTDTKQPPHVYLLEDGLNLWSTFLKNTRNANESLIYAYSNVLTLIEFASETFDTCLSITRSYLLLDAAVFLKAFGPALQKLIRELFGTLKDDANEDLAKVLHMIVKTNVSEQLPLFSENIVKLVQLILADDSYNTLTTTCISAVGYLLLLQPNMFGAVVHRVAELNNVQDEVVMGRLLDVWLEKIDVMTQSNDRKLSVICLMSLLPMKVSYATERFALILDMTVNVLYGMAKNEGTDQDSQTSVSSLFDGTEFDCETERKNSAEMNDPVTATSILPYVKQKLVEAERSYGTVAFNQAMTSLDPVVATQLMNFVKS